MGIKDRNDGFTLIEMIVVITVMGILLGIMVPAGLQYIEKSKAKECEVNRRAILADLSADRIYEPGKTVEAVLEKGVAYTCPSGGTYSQGKDSDTIICSIPEHGGNSAMSEEEESVSYPDVIQPTEAEKPEETAQYMVEYYLETSPEHYEEDAARKKTLTAKVDSMVTITPENIEGYLYQETHKDNVKEGKVTKDGSLVLKLYYQKEKGIFTVSFETGRADVTVAPVEVEEGKSIQEPELEEFKKELNGWYTDSNFVELWDFTKEIHQDITLYAKWKEKVDYKVEHWLQNVEGDGYTLHETEDLVGDENETVTASDRKYPGFTVKQPVEDYKLTLKKGEENVLKVAYDRNMVTVSFENPASGKVTADMPDQQKIRYGAKAVKPKDPDASSAQYMFIGWFTDRTCQNLYEFDSPVEKDTVLYAGWSNEVYHVTFYVRGAGQGNTDKETVVPVRKNMPVERPEDPVAQNGKTFNGWYNDKKEQWDFNQPVTEDMTLYGCFENEIVDGLYMPVKDLKFQCEDLVELAKKGIIGEGPQFQCTLKKGTVLYDGKNYYMMKNDNITGSITSQENGYEIKMDGQGSDIIKIDNSNYNLITECTKKVNGDYLFKKEYEKGSIFQFEDGNFRVLMQQMNGGFWEDAYQGKGESWSAPLEYYTESK